MNGDKKPFGYTIVEVMIVLAVSGVLFIFAALFISGKQSSTSFTTGTNEMASNIQTIVSQVENGQYTDVPFTCSTQSGSIVVNGQSLPGSTLGTNQDCVYFGKLLHVSPAGTANSYETLTIIGSSNDTSNNYSSAVALSSNDTHVSNLNLTTSNQTPQNININNITVQNGSNTSTVWNLAILSSFNTADANNAGLYYVNGVPSGASSTESELIGAMNANHFTKVDSASICLTDGNRYSKIGLGSQTGNSQLNVSLTYLGQSSGAALC